jgi:hypothetical protein
VIAALVLAAGIVSESSALGPQPQGQTALTALAGQPFWSLRLDHGFTQRFDAGLGVDLSPQRGILRPLLVARARALSSGPWQVALVGAAGAVVPAPRIRPARRVLRTLEAELAAQAELLVAPHVMAVAEAGLLALSDLSADHSLLRARGLVGAEWAPAGPFSLLAQGGALFGARGPTAVGAAGASFRFR